MVEPTPQEVIASLQATIVMLGKRITELEACEVDARRYSYMATHDCVDLYHEYMEDVDSDHAVLDAAIDKCIAASDPWPTRVPQPKTEGQCTSCNGLGSTDEVADTGDQRVECPDCAGTGKASKQITPPKLNDAPKTAEHCEPEHGCKS